MIWLVLMSALAAEPAFVGASDIFRGKLGDDNDNKGQGWLWETAMLTVEEDARVRLDGWFSGNGALMAVDYPDGSRREYPLIDKKGPEVDMVADHAGLWKIEVRVKKQDARIASGWGVEWSTLRAVNDASPDASFCNGLQCALGQGLWPPTVFVANNG
jgi:hypothetical protein